MKLLLLCTVFVLATTIGHANDDGKNGRTSRLGDGCGDCHGLSVSTNIMVTLIGVDGAPSVAPGSTTTFTIRVAHAEMPSAGINIAVVDAMDTGSEVGTLIPGAGLKVKGAAGELVHSSPMALSGGVADFTFEWTAPTTTGTYYLQAIGNAVNGNGEEDDGDEWAWMNPIQITVSEPSGVDEEAVADHLSIAPNPCPVGAPVTLQGLPVTAQRITITSISGETVYTSAVPFGASSIPVEVPSLPSGTYAVSVHTRNGVLRSMIVLMD